MGWRPSIAKTLLLALGAGVLEFEEGGACLEGQPSPALQHHASQEVASSLKEGGGLLWRWR